MSEIRPRLPSDMPERLEDVLINRFGYDERAVYKADFAENLERLFSELED